MARVPLSAFSSWATLSPLVTPSLQPPKPLPPNGSAQLQHAAQDSSEVRAGEEACAFTTEFEGLNIQPDVDVNLMSEPDDDGTQTLILAPRTDRVAQSAASTISSPPSFPPPTPPASLPRQSSQSTQPPHTFESSQMPQVPRRPQMSQPPLRPEPAPPLPTQQPQPPQPPLSRSYAACPFPPRPDINAIFGLARGALDPHIDVDAIVVPNNEAFTMRTGATGEVFLAAGPSLSRAISIIGDCPTGDCRVTPGFELPCRHIIHAAAPRFQAKFANAAHSALHSCYRSALQLAVVKHARTVGIGQMHSATRGYPTEEAAHIVLRTVRRFLEKNATAIDTLLLFCDDASDFAIYHKLATLYFPRTEAEAAASAVGLADVELGDEHGEISSEERRIRIGNGPLREENAGAAALSDAKLPFWANGNSPSRRPELSAGFMAVAPTPEELREQRRKSLAATRPPVKAAPLPPQQPQVEDDSTEGDAVRLYEKLLLIAPSSPLSEAEKFVYISGRDKHGRSTAVIIGSRLHARCRTDRERDSVWLRLLHETEELVRKPFSVAFIATGMPSDSGPTFDFLRDYFMTLPWHVQSNLGSFYLMHPSWKMRIAFVSAAIRL